MKERERERENQPVCHWCERNAPGPLYLHSPRCQRSGIRILVDILYIMQQNNYPCRPGYFPADVWLRMIPSQAICGSICIQEQGRGRLRHVCVCVRVSTLWENQSSPHHWLKFPTGLNSITNPKCQTFIINCMVCPIQEWFKGWQGGISYLRV